MTIGTLIWIVGGVISYLILRIVFSKIGLLLGSRVQLVLIVCMIMFGFSYGISGKLQVSLESEFPGVAQILQWPFRYWRSEDWLDILILIAISIAKFAVAAVIFFETILAPTEISTRNQVRKRAGLESLPERAEAIDTLASRPFWFVVGLVLLSSAAAGLARAIAFVAGI